MFYSFNYYRCTICIYACVLCLYIHCTAFYSPATEALINNNNNNYDSSVHRTMIVLYIGL